MALHKSADSYTVVGYSASSHTDGDHHWLILNVEKLPKVEFINSDRMMFPWQVFIFNGKQKINEENMCLLVVDIL